MAIGQIVNDKPLVDKTGTPVLFGVDFSGLEASVDRACTLIEKWRAEREVTVQLLREAVDVFENPETVVDLRDWVATAKAAIAKAEGRS